MLKKIFDAKRDEITGEWRTLPNSELHELHTSPNIIRILKWRRMRWPGHVARMEQSRNAECFTGRLQGKRHLVRPRCSWEIKMDL